MKFIISGKIYFFLAIFILFIFGYYFFQSNPQINKIALNAKISATPPVLNVLGQKIKSAGCLINGVLPDKDCTPGMTYPNVTKDQICVSGYSKGVRNVPSSEKDQVYAEYGITSHKTGEYEVDHFVSLELGGSNDIANLWPEPADPRPGFHEKDKVENYLHTQVCSGAITLEEAQREISTNWLEVYKRINQ